MYNPHLLYEIAKARQAELQEEADRMRLLHGERSTRPNRRQRINLVAVGVAGAVILLATLLV